ncbi:MAG TPA: hypothetical protein VF699_00930 [Caulobacteraceae bacterium]|jgi:hypothetical protein
MNWNNWIRQFHRWVAIAFTVGVLVYIVAMGQGQPPAWLGLFAAVPLLLLLLTGLYLFVLPYAARWSRPRRTGARA